MKENLSIALRDTYIPLIGLCPVVAILTKIVFLLDAPIIDGKFICGFSSKGFAIAIFVLMFIFSPYTKFKV